MTRSDRKGAARSPLGLLLLALPALIAAGCGGDDSSSNGLSAGAPTNTNTSEASASSTAGEASETGEAEGTSSTGDELCGDGICGSQEYCVDCPADCGPCSPVCGDAICSGEDCTSCAQDCGECPAACGNGSCDADETCVNCEQDCGECPPICGDAKCTGDETCRSCENDCGECPAPDQCPCKPNDPDFDNFCHWPPNTPMCPMTASGGYCDPNGDQSYEDADWVKGYNEYQASCA